RKSLLRITFRQLEIFRAVCESRSYSRAARVMALTQPAVSSQIRQLEEVIGQPLFEYVARKLYLTDAAEALLQTSEDVFARLESLDMQLSDLRGTLQGQLTLAVESSAQYFVPHLFGAFRNQHPEVVLHLTVANRAQILQRLADNLDDLVIMSLVPQDMALEFLPFMNNPIVAVAPAAQPLCAIGPVTLAQLQEWPLLIREAGSGTRKACEEYFQQQRVRFARTYEVSSFAAQAESVAAGLGLALMPRHAIGPQLASGQLHELPVEELPLYRSWCAVHARGKRLSPVAEAFLAFIRTERAQIGALASRFGGTPNGPLSGNPPSPAPDTRPARG